MATEFSILSIMNAALLAQGQEEILAENDGSLEWRTLFRNWPGIVEAELEDGMYHFTRNQVELVTRSDGKFGYDDAYLIPASALHVRRLWVEIDSIPYDVDWIQDGTHVYVNSDDGCFVEYVEASDPSIWSANFTRGIQKRLEAVISRVREEFGEAESLDQAAEMYFQRARTISSKSKSQRSMFKKGPIAKARRGRRG